MGKSFLYISITELRTTATSTAAWYKTNTTAVLTDTLGLIDELSRASHKQLVQSLLDGFVWFGRRSATDTRLLLKVTSSSVPHCVPGFERCSYLAQIDFNTYCKSANAISAKLDGAVTSACPEKVCCATPLHGHTTTKPSSTSLTATQRRPARTRRRSRTRPDTAAPSGCRPSPSPCWGPSQRTSTAAQPSWSSSSYTGP